MKEIRNRSTQIMELIEDFEQDKKDTCSFNENPVYQKLLSDAIDILRELKGYY